MTLRGRHITPYLLAGLLAGLPAFAAGPSDRTDHGADRTAAHAHAAPAARAHVQGAAASLPRETGQSAFAAIQEIVALLEADPATDWSRVDIEALRQHLLDMHLLTLESRVTAMPVPGGARFSVNGAGRVREAIQRMLPAHARSMDGAGGWRMQASPTPSGAVLEVTGPDPAAEQRIRALGLVGIMTRGMHHQAHHLAIARGHQPHH